MSQCCSRALVVATPEELVHAAVDRMSHHDIGRVLVVDPTDSEQLVGYLSRSSVLRARVLRQRDESVREGGWLQSRTPG